MRKIKNIYVSSDFLSDDLITKKSEEIDGLMDHGIRQNRSSFPVACFHFQSYNFSKYSGEKIPAIIILIMHLRSPSTCNKKKKYVMYFSASALAGFKIIILLTLQIIIGNMYQLTGLIIAGLMAGLAIGSGVNIKLLNRLSCQKLVFYLLLFTFLTGLLYDYISAIKSDYLQSG